ncbi:MAG: hypothetical protein ACREL1_06150 [bacterium]
MAELAVRVEMVGQAARETLLPLPVGRVESAALVAMAESAVRAVTAGQAAQATLLPLPVGRVESAALAAMAESEVRAVTVGQAALGARAASKNQCSAVSRSSKT